jgi:hypothetical protein
MEPLRELGLGLLSRIMCKRRYVDGERIKKDVLEWRYRKE